MSDKIVVLYVSRNKDNKHLEDFKERRISKLVEDNPERIKREFDRFVENGRQGEFCRCYISLCARKEDVVKKKLIHALIDDDVDLTRIEAKIASLAMQPECAVEKKWLWDFDIDDEEQVKEFVNDILVISPLMSIEYLKTVHGYSVITTRFDIIPLLKKWESRGITRNELKKDNIKLIMWRTKE